MRSDAFVHASPPAGEGDLHPLGTPTRGSGKPVPAVVAANADTDGHAGTNAGTTPEASPSADPRTKPAPAERGDHLALFPSGLDQTEVAEFAARLAIKLPFDAQVDLARLLENSLADPIPGLDRSRSLGLVMRMAREHGEIPKAEAYDAAHAAAVVAGERWPDRRSLCRRFGSWMGVIKAVTQLLSRTRTNRVARNFKHGKDRPAPGSYSNPELVDQAIIACWQWLGDWPTEWEFFTWGEAQRAAARAAGKPLPLIPTRKPLRRARGDYAAARAFAYDRACQLGFVSA
jgi:hypothetical protein